MSEEENIYKNKSDEVAENIVAAEGESERKDAPLNGEDEAFKNGESLENRVNFLSPMRLVMKRFFR